MNPLQHSGDFAAAAARLSHTLSRCALRPGETSVHHLRTGTRRVEAALETLRTQQPHPVEAVAAPLQKLLHKMRHRAGAVRDADVQLALLRTLRQQATAVRARCTSGSPQARRAAGLIRACRALEAALAKRRAASASALQHRAAKWQHRLDARAGAVLHADPQMPQQTEDAAKDSAGDIALRSFVRLCQATPVLDASTLHGFRKGAKRARYQAEAGSDARSRRIAAQLKQMQDAIGAWHDWLALSEQARQLATPDAASTTLLVRRLETRRDRQYRAALRVTGQLQARLLAAAARHASSGGDTHRRAA